MIFISCFFFCICNSRMKYSSMINHPYRGKKTRQATAILRSFYTSAFFSKETELQVDDNTDLRDFNCSDMLVYIEVTLLRLYESSHKDITHKKNESMSKYREYSYVFTFFQTQLETIHICKTNTPSFKIGT